VLILCLAVYTSGEAKWGLAGRLRGSRSLIFSLRPQDEDELEDDWGNLRTIEGKEKRAIEHQIFRHLFLVPRFQSSSSSAVAGQGENLDEDGWPPDVIFEGWLNSGKDRDFAYERSLPSYSLLEPVAGFGGYFVVQPLEPGIINVFRRDLGEKVRIVNVLSDHLLDCATVFRVGLHDQNHFSLFHHLPFFTVCAGDWKPISANRQPPFQQCATDLACLVSSIECDIIDSHNKNGAIEPTRLPAYICNAAAVQNKRFLYWVVSNRLALVD